MNKSLLYILGIFILISGTIFHISCNKNNKKNNTKAKNLITVKKEPVNAYVKFDECECHKEAMEILDIVIEIRNTFESVDELRKHNESKKEIKTIAKSWQLLMKTCFEKNFARMFEPSDCNDLKSLEKKKRRLHDLGVQIDQGENIRL